MMIMMGEEGCPVGHPDCQGHRAVLVVEVAILVKVTKGQVKPWLGVVVESGQLVGV